MKIINKTKNTVLAEEAVVADTIFRRVKGLLGRRDFIKGEALIIKPCNSIHTLLMRFPIDVLFVDKHNQVIKVVSPLVPSRLTRIYFNSVFVIELPAGTVQSTLTSKGDTISIE
jgi:uncharacterized membrane protein (UPF0127 family)